MNNDFGTSNTQGSERDGSNNVVTTDEVDELKVSVKSKVENNKTNSDTLYKVLITLVEKYPSILNDVDELL